MIFIIGLFVLLSFLFWNPFSTKGSGVSAPQSGEVQDEDQFRMQASELIGVWLYEDESWNIQMVFEDDDRVTIHVSESSGEGNLADYENGAAYFGEYELDDSTIVVTQMTGFTDNLEEPPLFLSDGDFNYPYKYHRDTGALEISFLNNGVFFSFTK
ncbi:MAG: hypothetical protein FWF83_00680 [Clostridiales bacterium]|nr:hypothetical protein [Clostridiales bacterium]